MDEVKNHGECRADNQHRGQHHAQFRDPEGTLVGLYTPVTDAAKKRFGSR